MLSILEAPSGRLTLCLKCDRCGHTGYRGLTSLRDPHEKLALARKLVMVTGPYTCRICTKAILHG